MFGGWRHRSIIFIPASEKGEGWQQLSMVLEEVTFEEKVVVTLRPLLTVQPQLSFQDVLKRGPRGGGFQDSGRVGVEVIRRGIGGDFTALEPARHHSTIGRVSIKVRKGRCHVLTTGHTCTLDGAQRNCGGAIEARGL